MKKLLFKTVLFVLSVLGIANAQNVYKEEGSLINGTIWATRNVSMPNTFVENPEDYGMLYKWNSTIGWSTTDPVYNSNSDSIWDERRSEEHNQWEMSNNVCPSGWRLPTLEEVKSLLSQVNPETKLNGVNGKMFGWNDDNVIFLPKAGWRDNDGVGNDDGILFETGNIGRYWTSSYDSVSMSPATLVLSEDNYYTAFDSGASNYYTSHALSVRCVKDTLVDSIVITPPDSVVVTPADSSALIVWKPNENANGYRLQIYLDENRTDLICEILFDADGLFKGIIIHRARTKDVMQRVGFSYQVTNLSSGTEYYYEIAALDEGGAVLETTSGTFATTNNTTGLEVVEEVVTPLPIAYYNLLGTSLPKAPEKGIYIILYDDGSVEKVAR